MIRLSAALSAAAKFPMVEVRLGRVVSSEGSMQKLEKSENASTLRPQPEEVQVSIQDASPQMETSFIAVQRFPLTEQERKALRRSMKRKLFGIALSHSSYRSNYDRELILALMRTMGRVGLVDMISALKPFTEDALEYHRYDGNIMIPYLPRWAVSDPELRKTAAETIATLEALRKDGRDSYLRPALPPTEPNWTLLHPVASSGGNMEEEELLRPEQEEH